VDQIAALQKRLGPTLRTVLSAGEKNPLYADVALLAASWKEPAGLEAVRKLAGEGAADRRLKAIETLAAAGDAGVLALVESILLEKKHPLEFRGAVLTSLARLEDAKVALLLIAKWPALEAELQTKAIEVLTQRAAWSRALLEEIGRGKIPATALNVSQVVKLQSSTDKELAALVAAKWGTLRTERNPEREQIVKQMVIEFRKAPGDPVRGQAAFAKLCAQCHKIHGQGQDVGPDITSNGRASFEQLVSNVFDPSLVIGAAYQGRIVVTIDGRQLAGLPIEDSPQRIVLKMQGGKQETIPRDQIEEMQVSKLSLMPEGVEKQYPRGELMDLLAFLALDRPPSDREAKYIPGTPIAEK